MKVLPTVCLCVFVWCSSAGAASIDRTLAYRQALALYADNSRTPLQVRVTDRKAFADSKMLRLTYRGGGEAAVPALLFLPRQASRTHRVPCLIVLHGVGGSKELMAGFCRYLAEAGYASLAIDLYHHGERAPAASRGSVTAQQLQQELAAGVRQTAIDVRRGLDYVQTVPEINGHRLGVAGFSLGAIIGAVASGVDSRAKATILISGGGGWGEILKSLSVQTAAYRGQEVVGLQSVNWNDIGAMLAQEDPLTFAPHIAPRALLMINGAEDTTIAPARAEALYQAACSVPHAQVQRERLPHAGHLPSVDIIFPKIRRWLDGHV